MSDLYARCPTCDRVWLVAALPMDMSRVAFLHKRAACAAGCTAKPLVGSAPDPAPDPVAEAALSIHLHRTETGLYRATSPQEPGLHVVGGHDLDTVRIAVDQWLSLREARALAQEKPKC